MWLRLRGERFNGGLDLHAASCAGDVERTDDKGFAGAKEGAAFEEGLADDRILREGTGAVFDDTGLLDLGFEAEGVGGVVQGGIEAHADVEVGDLRLWRIHLFEVGAGDDGYTVALLEDGTLARNDNHAVVLIADAFGSIEVDKGVGEAIGLAGLIESVDDLLRESDLVVGSRDEEGVSRWRHRDLYAWIEDVADGDEYLVLHLGRGGAGERKDMYGGG